MDTAKMLLELSALSGVAGREGDAADYARHLLEPYGKTSVTPLGSLLCTVSSPRAGRPHLLLDAHVDEIGMVVTYIEESGFLRVAPCGGVDRRLLLASPVVVHTADGPLDGVICSIPPHLNVDGDRKNKKVDEIHIDVGLSEERAAERIHPGDRVTIRSTSRLIGERFGGLVTGKALDDRAGCASHIKALEYLVEENLDIGLTVVFSSMEEVGGQGAKTAAYQANPTHALAVDVSFAHTPDAERHKTGELGGGPMVGYAPILSHRCSAKLCELAKTGGIPYQVEVMGGRTGTNCDSIVTARGGVETALLSIPQKYMHTPIEVVAVEDVENTGKLTAAFVRALNRGELA